jgi:hypothetical protein
MLLLLPLLEHMESSFMALLLLLLSHCHDICLLLLLHHCVVYGSQHGNIRLEVQPSHCPKGIRKLQWLQSC